MLYFGKTPGEIEFRRKLFLFGFLASVGNAFLIPLGIIALHDGNLILAAVIGLAAAFVTGTYLLARVLRTVFVPSLTLSFTLLLLSFYITVTGGKGGTGILYTYGLIAVVIMMLGHRLGALITLVYAAGVYLALTSNWLSGYSYTELYEQRILISTLSTVSLITVTEWIRVRSYDAITVTAENHHKDAMTDPLTGLFNRAGLEHALNDWPPDTPRSVVAMIDIDHFKGVNDRLGHDLGDQALTAFARVLRNSIKHYDLLCRWGGEEFVVVLRDIDLDTAFRTLEELRVLMANRVFVFGPHELTLHFSGGLALMASRDQFRAALHQADEHLYQAKRRGRNQISPSSGIRVPAVSPTKSEM
ncbi:GGDEF domain-containing protein [Saccharospirillum salsuginis]|uniref:diguanylate cyclase n=1 Tax=Saccharospirillum salsuginis TaxID=418750 RepID=A0A918KL81_9GAMM|nr:GGDEF domain-containing protein [Saccharospirillum salsuginis]GGX66706.1 hypothetical protein GCM10007392_38070 [Saccharospirillum salsuginis]